MRKYLKNQRKKKKKKTIGKSKQTNECNRIDSSSVDRWNDEKQYFREFSIRDDYDSSRFWPRREIYSWRVVVVDRPAFESHVLRDSRFTATAAFLPYLVPYEKLFSSSDIVIVNLVYDFVLEHTEFVIYFFFLFFITYDSFRRVKSKNTRFPDSEMAILVARSTWKIYDML